MSTHKVLIVDDDADDREMIREAFYKATTSKLEYQLIEDGNKLIENLYEDTHLPSLILLDLNMPGKDGREALKEIKKDDLFKHIPVLVFTTSSSPQDKKMAYELGANCFVTKPDTFTQLTELAKCFLRLWLQ